MKFAALIAQLHAAGMQTVVLPGCRGGKIVVTPHGGRILGVFTHEHADNAFFVNSELANPKTAKQYLAGVHLLGGDRLWIAPERGLFFKGDTPADGGVIQSGIDPGNWLLGKCTEKSIRLVNDFTATYLRTPGSRVRGIVERSIRSIGNPMAENLEHVHYAGYEIASRFDLLESPQDDLYFGLWFLMQLVTPGGGYLYVPTSGKAVITDYFEPTGPDYLYVTNAYVRFKLDSMERHKIGIRANEVLGRAGFLSLPDAQGQANLVVRNFLNNPSAHYADVPLHTPAGTQDSIQSYNHNTGPGGFAELGYHAPGINRALAEPTVTDVNQVWVFTGKREDLVPIAGKLLNLPIPTFAL